MTANRLRPSPNGKNGHGAAKAANGKSPPPTQPPASANGAAKETTVAAGRDAAGHDAKGRFAPGNGGGPGNPYARQVAELKKILLEETTPERLRNIIKKLLTLAEEGNVPAIKLVLSYALGKPQPAANPDQISFDEWQRLRETHDLTREMPMLAKAPDPELPLGILRVLREVGSEAQSTEALGLVSLPKCARNKVMNLPPTQRRDRLNQEAAKARRDMEQFGFVRSIERDLRKASPPDPFCEASQMSAAGSSAAAPSANGDKR
jgi:hypothetical protein